MLRLAALLTLACILCLSVGPTAADDIDIDLGTKSGNKICLGKICNDSSIFHYYVCCGQLVNDCCFRLQTWVIIVLIVVAISFVAGLVGGIIKCVCCCDR